MEIKGLFILAVIAFLSVAYLSAFRKKDLPNSIITSQYMKNVQDVISTLEQLSVDVHSLDKSRKSIKKVRKSFVKSRNAFKKVEFIIDYLDPEMYKDYINGPPLPSLMRNSPQPIVLHPEGYQIIEEILYGDEPYSEKDRLIKLIAALNNRMSSAKNMPVANLTDRSVFEAARYNLVRIFSLGVTGFDAPDSQNSISESLNALEAIHQAITCYYPYISKKDAVLKENIENTFLGGIYFLKDAADFERLDRLQFLKSYIDPLFAYLLDAHLLLEIETVYEVKGYRPPMNYFSRSIFANDFLDPIYFTKQKDLSGEDMVYLGKLLFFDPVLSGNNERSCSSCHHPEKAFTDGLPKSTGFNHEGTVDRNSMSLINAVFADRFFYDVRADFIEKQVDHVVANHKEFNTDYIQVIKKIKSSPEYALLFQKAFPQYEDNAISKMTIASALGAYVSSLTGFNSDFDKYVRGEVDEIDASVKNGFNLFMGKAGCGTCHFAPVFNGLVPPHFKETETEVLGIPATADLKKTYLDKDPGRSKGLFKEQSPIYNNSFKTVSVRNVELTAPYMHNGVFNSLEEVLEFYNEGGGAGFGLDVINQTLPPDKLNLSKKEMREIIAFMKALTDTSGIVAKPEKLPDFPESMNLNKRVIGGLY